MLAGALGGGRTIAPAPIGYGQAVTMFHALRTEMAGKALRATA